QITALLVRPHERRRSSQQIGNGLRDSFSRTIPSYRLQIGYPNAFGFGGYGGQPIQVLVNGIGSGPPGVLDDYAAQIEAAVRAIPSAANVQSSNQSRQTQVRAKVDWGRAADLGVTPQAAGIALRTAIDGFKSNATQFH